ncbi:MAG: hypothetical protein HOY71_06735 [Nonomuraea sp.]|nr:hypothetical protein [Nonomuraea sp.]
MRLILGYLVLLTVVGTLFYLRRPAPPAPLAASAAAPARERARVVWISDGDTITASPIEGPYAGREQRIRLIGLDAPEMHPSPQCWAKQSTDALAGLVPRGSTITMEFDRRRFDDYKRQLRYIWNSAGILVNAEQLRLGNARVLRIWPNVRHDKDFKTAADQARTAGRGLWKSC